jgi:transposase
MSRKRGRPPTFNLRTRKYFARLIEKHGVHGACQASKRPVSPGTMSKVAKEFGIRLQTGRRPFATSQTPRPKFTDLQQEQLRQILLNGPLASGYSSDRWTCRRITDVIHKSFSVKCHAVHLKWLLTKLGFHVLERSVMTVRIDAAIRPPFVAERAA